MNGVILLFGFDSLLQILALESAVNTMDVEVVPVARTDYNKPLGVLAGLDTDGNKTQPYAGGTLGGRMVVLCGLDKQLDEILPALNKAGAGPECLKAVLTPHNRGWNALSLYAELLREHQTMRKEGGRA